MIILTKASYSFPTLQASGSSLQTLLVTNVAVGTAAHDDDVRAGDILLAVNDAPIAKTGDARAVKKLCSASQRPLRLTFERPAQAGVWDDGGRLAQYQLEQGRKQNEKADARTAALEAALKVGRGSNTHAFVNFAGFLFLFLFLFLVPR